MSMNSISPRQTLLTLPLAFWFLASCSSTREQFAGPQASIHVTFSSNPPYSFEVPARTSATASRLLVDSADSRVTAQISLALPLQVGAIDLALEDRGIVWAQDGQTPPLVATMGTLTLARIGSTWTVMITEAAKESDPLSSGFSLSGTIEELVSD